MEPDFVEEYTKRRYKELLKQSACVRKIEDERVFVAKSEKDTMVVHFSNRDFKRCKEMARALDEVCHKFPGVEFCVVEAADFPFVTEKMAIGALPYLAVFSKGYFIDAIVGFEGIGEEKIDPVLLEKSIGSMLGQ